MFRFFFSIPDIPRGGAEDGVTNCGLGRKLADGVAVLRRKGACRLSEPGEDYLETPLDLTEYLIENKAATFMMRVDGDSMRDAGILDGDLLVVDRAAKLVNGSVVVVAVNGEYTVKRLRRCPDCVWLEPANPRYQPVRVGIGEELHVFGVVKHAIHSLR